MMTFTSLPSVPPDYVVPFTDQLRLAVAAAALDADLIVELAPHAA
jgi:hypothetical protein